MFEELGLNVARQEDNGANPRPDNRSGWLDGETPRTPIDELVDTPGGGQLLGSGHPAPAQAQALGAAAPRRRAQPRPEPDEQPTEELPALVQVDPRAAA